jgi:hypothetical protein
MRIKMIIVSDILQQLNEASMFYKFPLLDVYFPVDTRLSVFCDKQDWAIVIEVLEFRQTDIGHNCICTMIYSYGSNLPQAPGPVYPQLFLTQDGPSHALFDSTDIMQQFISPLAVDMFVRGKIIPIMTNPDKYAKGGIKLKQPPKILGYELLRLIEPAYKDLFFSTEEEITECIGKKMPLLLRLDEWFHPVDCLPGMCETFHMIAEVIAKNDPTIYQPTQAPNTHWSNWPMAGQI